MKVWHSISSHVWQATMSMNRFWKNSVGEELPCYIDSNTYGGNSQGTTRDYAARARGQVISKAAFVYDSMISYSSIHSTTSDRRLLWKKSHPRTTFGYNCWVRVHCKAVLVWRRWHSLVCSLASWQAKRISEARQKMYNINSAEYNWV